MAISNISVIGEAVYPHLNKPDVKWNEAGEYKVTLKVAKSDASEMLKLYNKAIDDSLKLAEEQHKGKGITHAPRPYNEENGFVFFKFKMKAIIAKSCATRVFRNPHTILCFAKLSWSIRLSICHNKLC